MKQLRLGISAIDVLVGVFLNITRSKADLLCLIYNSYEIYMN